MSYYEVSFLFSLVSYRFGVFLKPSYLVSILSRYKLDLTGPPLSRPESMTVFRLARGTKEIRIKKESGNSVSYCTPIPIVNIGNGICYDNISPGDIE
jgi:hypothetical protein